MIGPADRLDQLRARRDTPVRWLVTPCPADTAPLPLIDAGAVTASVSEIERGVGGGTIAGAWFLHRNAADLYLATIRGLAYAVDLPAPRVVVNLSVGPQLRHVLPDPADPMHVAIARATARGAVVVAAHGNAGDGDGRAGTFVNPWALGPDVISAGATTPDGSALLPTSSRGDPARPETWPDLVAPGQATPLGEIKTPPPGTSFAAPRVVEAVSRILRRAEGFGAHPWMNVAVRVEDFGKRARPVVPLPEGDLPPLPDGWCWSFAALPLDIAGLRTCLADLCRPLQGYGPHEVGAGCLDPARLDLVYGPPTDLVGRIVPIRVL